MRPGYVHKLFNADLHTSLSVSKMASGLIFMMISEAAIAPSLAAKWITVLPR